MEHNNDITLADIEKDMPKELRRAVHSTDTYQRYLFMRNHVDDLAGRRLRNGLPPDDESLRAARNKLSALTAELADVIERYRTESDER